jgi:hypothetical protein
MLRANRLLLPVTSGVSPTAITHASVCLSLAATGSAGGAVLAKMTAIGQVNLRRTRTAISPPKWTV